MSDPDNTRADVVPLGNGRYQVTVGGTRRTAFAVAGRDTWVFLDGRTHVIASAEERTRQSGSDAHAALTAPMPATVLVIHVVPGQPVARGDVVMVLEAMKMELPIRSPRDGVVRTVACKVGELVQPGSTLLELDDRNEKIDA